MGARRGATTGGAAGFIGANPVCILTWQGLEGSGLPEITPGPTHGPTEAKDMSRFPGSPISGAEPQRGHASAPGVRMPTLWGEDRCVPIIRPQCCQEEL